MAEVGNAEMSEVKDIAVEDDNEQARFYQRSETAHVLLSLR
jgi:hypothetical protein